MLSKSYSIVTIKAVQRTYDKTSTIPAGPCIPTFALYWKLKLDKKKKQKQKHA